MYIQYFFNKWYYDIDVQCQCDIVGDIQVEVDEIDQCFLYDENSYY